MAITIIGQPDALHPVYNPVVYYLDSTNKNQTGFRYVIQIFNAGTVTLLREFKVAPRPDDGYGYIDVSKILQTQTTKALDVFNNTYINADDNSIYDYDIKFGEEYINNIAPTFSSQFLSGATINTQITFGSAHGFVAGDQITINLSSVYGDCRDGLNGNFTVLASFSSTTLVINYAFQCSGPSLAITGNVSYSDNRKTQFLGLATLSSRVAFNAAYSTQDFISYDENDIILGDPTKRIITNAPRTGFTIFPFQNLFWNFFDNKSNLAGCILFENSGGETYRMITNGTTDYIKQINVANGSNLIPLTGSLPLIKDNIEWYDVWSSEDCSCVGSCDTIDITFDDGTSEQTVQVTTLGTYNGANYYKITTVVGGVFMWWDNINNWWVVSSVLGGGTIYLQSIVSTPECPPTGDIGVTWSISTALFTTFSVEVCSPLFGQSSEKFRIYINHNCPINETQLLFLDRSGSFSSFAFTLRQTQSGNVIRNSYNKEFGNLNSGKYKYNSFDAGLTTYSVSNESIYTLNTDWMTDEMSVYFEELLTSPEVYVKFDTSSDWISCLIQDNSYSTERSKNKILIKKTISIKLAIQDNINV